MPRKSYVQACARSAFEPGELAEAARRARSGNHRSRIENALRRILAALGDDPSSSSALHRRARTC